MSRDAEGNKGSDSVEYQNFTVQFAPIAELVAKQVSDLALINFSRS